MERAIRTRKRSEEEESAITRVCEMRIKRDVKIVNGRIVSIKVDG